MFCTSMFASPTNGRSPGLLSNDSSSSSSSKNKRVYPHAYESLKTSDPEVFKLCAAEKHRQNACIELIASENFTSKSVMQSLGSVFTNKYSEGYPGKRYYGGNTHVDELERLCQARALESFALSSEEWGCNVQPYSGSPANFAVYTALLNPHDRIMGLDLPSGGHLTHGFYSAKGVRVSATSKYFESFPYKVSAETGHIDHEELLQKAIEFRPKLIICGGSAYPREWKYDVFRDIADRVDALLMCDMAHISGLVAAGEAASPFEYADVVTTTTHKSLRGPRGGIVFFRKKWEKKINNAVFPGLQGGPHNNQIAALAVALKQTRGDDFNAYAKQVRANARALSQHLIDHGYKLSTNGTDNHLILWDLRPLNIPGDMMQTLCDFCGITLNKNSVPGDKSALYPGGVRIGTPAMTSRGLTEPDFKEVGNMLHRAAQLCLDIIKSQPEESSLDLAIKNNPDVQRLKNEVESFALLFPQIPCALEDEEYSLKNN